MVQPVRNKKIKQVKGNSQRSPKNRKHKEYGTSKLEERFAKDFLDKLGVEYQYQYKAEEIGRYYDFCVTLPSGSKTLLEIDGDYFHSYGLQHEQKNPMQKHNEYVDRIKDEWALMHGIPIIRIWEHDINDNPSKVMKTLKEMLGEYDEKNKKKKDKNRRH